MTAVVAERDPFGVTRVYYRADGFGRAESLAALRPLDPAFPLRLDAAGVAEHWGETPMTGRTCWQGIRELRPGERLTRGDPWTVKTPPPKHPPVRFRQLGMVEVSVSPERRPPQLSDLVAGAVEQAAGAGARTALALSGGLDSAVLLALLRRLGFRIPVYILSPRLPGYDETDAAVASARHFGVEPIVVEAGEADFAAALPECIRATEVPLWNLHPVSRFLLAQSMAADGIDAMITGDGADQVFGHTSGEDYLPIIAALAGAAGVRTRMPFLDAAVVDFARRQGPDPQKLELRWATEALLPKTVVSVPKTPRLAPPMDLSGWWDQVVAERLAAELGRPLRINDDRDRVRWTTLILLHKAFRGD